MDIKDVFAYNKFNDGNECFGKEDYSGAITAYTAVINSGAGPLSEAYLKRGIAHFKNGESDDIKKETFDNAKADFEKALELNPNDSDAKQFLELLNNMYKAKTEMNKAKTDAKTAAAHFQRGNDCADRGKNDEAIEAYTTVIRLNPNDPHVYYNRGIVYFQKGEYYNAKADFEKALQLNPNHSGAKQNLGIVNSTLQGSMSIGRASQNMPVGVEMPRVSIGDAVEYRDREHRNWVVVFDDHGRELFRKRGTKGPITGNAMLGGSSIIIYDETDERGLYSETGQLIKWMDR